MGFFNQWIVLRCPFIIAGGQRRFVRRDEIRRGTKAVLRHCGLRPRCKRPRRRAADQRDELSSLHCQHTSICFKNFLKPNLHRPSVTLVASRTRNVLKLPPRPSYLTVHRVTAGRDKAGARWLKPNVSSFYATKCSTLNEAALGLLCVIRDRVKPAASPAMSGMPRKRK